MQHWLFLDVVDIHFDRDVIAIVGVGGTIGIINIVIIANIVIVVKTIVVVSIIVIVVIEEKSIRGVPRFELKVVINRLTFKTLVFRFFVGFELTYLFFFFNNYQNCFV